MKRDRRVMVRFDEAMHERLTARADERGIPVATLVRLATWKYLSDEDATPTGFNITINGDADPDKLADVLRDYRGGGK